MNVVSAYREWSTIYDVNDNPTRDLEALVLKSIFSSSPSSSSFTFGRVLEVGAGTGKNTQYIGTSDHTISCLSIDISPEMIEIARSKLLPSSSNEKVSFHVANILDDEVHTTKKDSFDSVVFSLVLEHIENLSVVFRKLARCVAPGGCVYVCEYHPFKQYAGLKARFTVEDSGEEIECEAYVHNVSDYILAAQTNGFRLIDLQEHFDNDNRKSVPRLISIMFTKPC